MLKTENNIYNLPYNDLKEYLCFIEHIFDEIEFDMQIYKDFNNARITQQIKPNYFIYWCIRNYYKSLVLNLCKLLEPRKDDKNKFTLTHFIDLLKYEPNLQTLKEEFKQKTIKHYDIRTGETEEENVEHIYLEQLNNINFDNDAKEIEKIHRKIKDFRNKKLAHNDKKYDGTKLLPSVNELHNDVQKIELIFKTYFSLFGIGVNYDSFKSPNFYGNFQLNLR